MHVNVQTTESKKERRGSGTGRGRVVRKNRPGSWRRGAGLVHLELLRLRLSSSRPLDLSALSFWRKDGGVHVSGSAAAR